MYVYICRYIYISTHTIISMHIYIYMTYPKFSVSNNSQVCLHLQPCSEGETELLVSSLFSSIPRTTQKSLMMWTSPIRSIIWEFVIQTHDKQHDKQMKWRVWDQNHDKLRAFIWVFFSLTGTTPLSLTAPIAPLPAQESLLGGYQMGYPVTYKCDLQIAALPGTTFCSFGGSFP